MRVAIYARVSTEEQAKEGYSIDAQKQRLSEFVSSQGWIIYDFYIDDGYSAKNLDRPNMKRMIKDIKNKHFDVVLVYKLDRMVRSVMNLHELLQLFEKYNVKFRSATEMFDTTSAMGRFFITLVGAMAQWEREQLAERVKMGMEQKHLKGERNGAVAPFGYELIDGELIINPSEAEIVKRIYKLYLANKSTRYISKLFNLEHIPKRETKFWSDNTIYYILTNPVYKGKIRWNYRENSGHRTGEEIISEGSQEAIISEETFEQVQFMRGQRRKEGKKVTSDFSFTGVLRCGRCNYGMIGTSRKTKTARKRSYKCLGRFNYGICDMPMIAEESVNEAFLAYLESDEDEIVKLLDIQEDDAPMEYSKLIDQIHNELESIKRRKKKWQRMYADDLITEDELIEHTQDDNSRDKFLKTQLAELPNKQATSWTLEELKQQFKQIKQAWEKINDDTAKKQFIGELYESIVINTEVTEAKGGPGRKVPVDIVSLKLKA